MRLLLAPGNTQGSFLIRESETTPGEVTSVGQVSMEKNEKMHFSYFPSLDFAPVPSPSCPPACFEHFSSVSHLVFFFKRTNKRRLFNLCISQHGLAQCEGSHWRMWTAGRSALEITEKESPRKSWIIYYWKVWLRPLMQDREQNIFSATQQDYSMNWRISGEFQRLVFDIQSHVFI